MSTWFVLKPVFLAGVLGWNTLPLAAEDLTTTSGAVFRNVAVTKVESDSLVVRHSAGVVRIKLSELPAEWRHRYSAPQLFDEWMRQTAEVERLKSDLERSRHELEALRPRQANDRQANDELKPGAPSRSAVAFPTDTRAKTVVAADSLPPLKPDDSVKVSDIVAHYKSDPAAADRRYKKKTFRIDGTVERFDEKIFVRNIDVILESPERFVRVVCNMPYAEEVKAVFARQDGQRLVGVYPGGERELMRVGEKVVFKGHCGGLRNSAVIFQNCERIR